MPLPENRMTKYYNHIAEITGVDYGTGSQEDIRRALGSIYVDGHNVLNILGCPSLNNPEATEIRTISELLDKALSATDTKYSFVSVMNPDDPFAVPRMIQNDQLYDAEGKALDSTEELVKVHEAKKKAAESYAKNFKSAHSKNIARLNNELKTKSPVDGEQHKIGNFLSSAVYDSNTNKLLKESRIRIDGNDLALITNMCNLVLLDRGYTMEELSGNGVNIQEGRAHLGKQLEEIFFNNGNVPFATQFASLADEAIHALESMSMKFVDLSDDSTFENVKSNQQIADMASDLQKVIVHINQGCHGLDNQEKRIRTITNYTDGVMTLDTARFRAAQEKAADKTAEKGIMAQTLVDAMSPGYMRYRTGLISSVKNELSMTALLDEVVDRDRSFRDFRAKEEYKNAHKQALQNGEPTEYKKHVTENILNPNENLKQAVTNSIHAQNNEPILTDPDKSSWFTPAEGMVFADYRNRLLNCFGKASGVSQLDRIPTVGSLIAMYAAWDAKENNREFSIDNYLADKELQRDMGVKTLKFFEEHPIPAGDDRKKTEENVRYYGSIAAAFNTALDNMVIPTLDISTPEKIKEQKEYVTALKSFIQDSEQLRDLLPKEEDDRELRNIFYEQDGGREKYNEASNRRAIVKGVLSIEENYLTAMGSIADKSLDYLKGNPKDMNSVALVTTTYLLNHDAKKFMGKKALECPNDVPYSVYMIGMPTTGFNYMLKKSIQKAQKTRDDQKKLVDYVTSLGKIDALNLNTEMNGYRKANLEAMGVGEANQDDYTEPFEMVDPGDLKELEEAAENFEAIPDLDIKECASGDSHNWNAEISQRDWKARIELMDKMMADNDPALLHSSPEYKAVREGLKKAKTLLNHGKNDFDSLDFDVAMDKVFKNAGDYIQKKENSGKIGKRYGQKRLDAMYNLRGMLGKRNNAVMSLRGLAALCNKDSIDNINIPDQKFYELTFIKLGNYLDLAVERQKSNPEESKRMIDLVERVLEERGRNKETREQLQHELQGCDVTGTFENWNVAEQYLSKAKKQIFNIMSQKGSMTEKAANWFTVMDCYVEMAKNSGFNKVREIAEKENVKEVAMCGRLAERTIQTRYQAMDYDAPEQLTSKQASEMVAFSTLGEFMKHSNSEAHKKVFRTIVKNNADVDALCNSFEKLDVVKQLCNTTDKDTIRKLASRSSQNAIGLQGMKEYCKKMAKEIEKPFQLGEQKHTEKVAEQENIEYRKSEKIMAKAKMFEPRGMK